MRTLSKHKMLKASRSNRALVIRYTEWRNNRKHLAIKKSDHLGFQSNSGSNSGSLWSRLGLGQATTCISELTCCFQAGPLHPALGLKLKETVSLRIRLLNLGTQSLWFPDLWALWTPFFPHLYCYISVLCLSLLLLGTLGHLLCKGAIQMSLLTFQLNTQSVNTTHMTKSLINTWLTQSEWILSVLKLQKAGGLNRSCQCPPWGIHRDTNTHK